MANIIKKLKAEMNMELKPAKSHSDTTTHMSSRASYSTFHQDNMLQNSETIKSKIQQALLKTNWKMRPSSTLKANKDDSSKNRCDRKVYRSKYETNAMEIRNWWNELFQTLENDKLIPPEEQLSVLEDIFDITMRNKLLKICNVRHRKFKEELEVISEDDPLSMLRQKQTGKIPVSNMSTDRRIVTSSKQTLMDPEDLKEAAKEVYVKTERENLDKIFEHHEVPKSKMYTDFFKRKPNRAAIWRTLPPLSMNEMNLNQKAGAITKQIATDFIDWLRDLGGDEELSLSVEAIIEMFEIGFHANSATSLKVNVKEMPSVPRRVAEAKNLPRKAKRAVLRREIKKDITASKKKTTFTAFGAHLPYSMQMRPPAENYYRKWMSCDRVPEKLATMAAVWQGITHLKSTRAYCEFLIERPDIKPPKYLSDCGMMDLKNLQDKEKDVSDELSVSMRSSF